MNVRAKVAEWVPAIVVFCLGIVVWQLAIDIFDIQKFLLPKPGSIVRAFFTQRHTLWSAGWLTLKEALGGRSEEHMSELQSLTNLVCRLLLEIGRASCRERV